MEINNLRPPSDSVNREQRWREDFPLLGQNVNNKPLVYLDNAATTQKPRAVIEAEVGFYQQDNANVHRGVHALSQRATDAYEAARETVRAFLSAASTREIVFVRGTTEAINLVAQSHTRPLLGPNDNVIVTTMEHHSNIVPWQMACAQTGAELRVAPVNDAGELDMEMFSRLIGPNTRMVALTHLSNALGTINPVRRVIELAHANKVPVLLDGAQAVSHLRTDVRELDCDFYVFSGHKIYGPTGIGVLYGREAWLEIMQPYQTGGDMIRSVTFGHTEYNDLPYKFEAGTPNIAGAIGLAAALDYVRRIGIDAIASHEHDLLTHAEALVSRIDGIRIIGNARRKASILSFTLDGVHPHDIGTILDHHGIAIRAGHHCAMPIMQRFGLAGTARASFALYNTRAEIEAFADALHKLREMFA